MLERDNQALRQELKASREKTSEILKELTHSREETRSVQQRCEELHHEIQRYKDAGARAESLKIAEAQAESALLKQELRSRDSHIASQQDQIRAESERVRSMTEHAEQQRREVDDLRSKLQAAMDKCESTLTQASRRDELVKLLEADIGHKQQRLEQSERLVSTLQNQTGEKELQAQKWQGEAENRARAMTDMETQVRKLDAARTEAEQRGERTRAMLQELCDMLGTAVDSHGLGLRPHGAAAKLREVLATETRLRQELTEVRQAAELRQYELQTRDMASEQVRAESGRLQEALRAKDSEINALREELLTRTRDLRGMASEQTRAETARLQDALRAKDSEINTLREELLVRTRDLRSLTLTHTTTERDDRTRYEQLQQLQLALQQKDQIIADRDKMAREQSSRDQAALLEARNESLRASTEHSRALGAVQARMAELELQLRTDSDFVEACRRIGHVLCVDPTTSPAMYAQSLVQAVERLSRECGTRVQHETAVHAGNARAVADGEWLKTQLMESEQRFVKAQVRHDTLTHDLARLLGLADAKDTDAIIAEVSKLKHKRAPAPPTTPPTRGRPTTATVSAKDKEIHKQLLETIAQQDRWIATLLGRDPASRELLGLRDETVRLRAIAGTTWTGAGTGFGAGAGTAAGAIVGDRSAVQDLEARLQRHIDFRTALLRTLKMPTASATDDTILRRVEQLMAEATKPSFSTHASLAGPGTLFRDALTLPGYGLGGDKLRLATPYLYE